MRSPLRTVAQFKFLLLVAALTCSGVLAQTAGRPDLEGTWTNASLTNPSDPKAWTLWLCRLMKRV